VASKLNISSRTLQRQLSNEKTSFKALLQKTRFDLATDLLKNKEFTISEISYMLGYSDLGNFSRSFKKYAGISPQDYRRSEGSI
jgi:AraC-like DNA-binding protein